jgi:ABC-2 type transport system ATP-binding protein
MIECRDVVLASPEFVLRIPALSLSKGCAAALVGKNGGGKTTLLEALLALRLPQSGSVLIEGKPNSVWLSEQVNKRRLGAQLQRMAYPAKTRVGELVQLHAVIYGGKQNAALARALAVQDLATRYYENLSRGEKQRVDIFIAMAHGPELLLLDEPTTGLDANFLDRALEAIQDQSLRTGITLVYATHNSRELQLGRDLVLIEKGAVRQHTVAGYLTKELGQYCGEMALTGSLKTISEVLDAASRLPSATSVRVLANDCLLAFGTDESFKTAFESFAHALALPYAVRLVNHDDVLRVTACKET